LFEDPLAVGFLGPMSQLLFRLLLLPALGPLLLGVGDRLAAGARGFVVGRTRFIDDALVGALNDGFEQVVILGAGYDSRAYRIPGIESARVFEVDHPGTQSRKRNRLYGLLEKIPDHVTFVCLDFERQDIADGLASAGFQSARRTFFVCEGVTEYLSPGGVDRLFRSVAGLVKGESRIAFTYMDRRVLNGRKHVHATKVFLAIGLLSNEPLRFGLDPHELQAYLFERGLNLVEDVAGVEFAERYFGPSRRILRANEHQRTVLARISGPLPRGIGYTL
jgi:methyltransferase (TIGR00027 family)